MRSDFLQKALFFCVIIASVSSCSTNTAYPNGNRIFAIDERLGKEIRGKDEIVKLILSLPEFRYHEESRDDFSKRLVKASKAQQKNRIASKDFLLCPSDGTFPAREFSWNDQTSILTVKFFSPEARLPRLDKWKRIEGKWLEYMPGSE